MANQDLGLFPMTTEEEEQQFRMAIMMSLQSSEIESSVVADTNEESDPIEQPTETKRSYNSKYSRANTSAELYKPSSSFSDSSPQMMLRRSMSIGNGSPPRTNTVTDCCEVKNALLVKDREYIKWLVSSWGRTTSPLHAAVRKGHDYCLEPLLKAFPDLINSVNSNGETPLYLAAIHSKPRAVQQLLQFQADPNIGRSSQETPLLAAVDNDHREVAISLLKAGADVNKYLNRGWTVLHEAVYRGHAEILGILLRHGGNPNTRDGFGISPVFTSAACGRNECLKTLLQAGGNANLCAKSKSASPLYEACKEGHADCVKTLLSHGANPHIVNCDGLYPIHIAAYRGHEEIVESLLSITDRQQAQSCGMSPIHSAAKGDHVDILQMLINHGYDVNIKLTKDKITYRDRRQTALFFSVYNDSEEATEILLEAGADTELDYVKPLLVAVSHSQYDMVNLLLSHGADVNASFSEDATYFPAAIPFAIKDFSGQPYYLFIRSSMLAWRLAVMASEASLLVVQRVQQARMLKQVLSSGCDVAKCLHCHIGNEDHLQHNEMERRKSFCHFLTEEHNQEWCGCTVEYLLNFAGNMKLCRQVIESVQHTEEWLAIKELTENPRALKHLCRLKIRDTLGTNLVRVDNVFKQLPLPKVLKQYLTFAEV